jgi:hypothetical protein
MSVLSFPRIYFKGFMEWDPCTFNNNDWSQFPTYDPTNAALNWEFLVTHQITPENFTETFRPWAITLVPDDVDSPSGPRVPCEWNMFGTHGVSFVQNGEYTSQIIGGDLAYGQPATNDPLIGGPIAIAGDGGNGPGRLVDTNPASPWSTQVYFGQMSFGAGENAVIAPRAFRMQSRWLNANRIYSSDQVLTAPAAGIGVCFQTCIPYKQVKWPADCKSDLINELKKAAAQPDARGIMIRFTGYVNVYFANGKLNDEKATPRNFKELAADLKAGWDTYNNSGGKDTSGFFSNPCYSHIVGTIGVWNDGELASVPSGRTLNADVAVLPMGITNSAPNAAPQAVRIVGHELKSNSLAVTGSPVPLGPVAAHIDYKHKLISLDLGSTMPENGTPGSWPSDLMKTNFGPLTFGVMNGTTFTGIATISYEQYARAAYEARAGIVDLPFPDSGTEALLKSGSLAIQVQGQTALLEQNLTAETDRRGIYLNQGERTEFEVVVTNNGARAAGVNVLIARYDAGLSLIATGQPGLVNFTNGTAASITVTNGNPPPPTITADVITVTTDSNGSAKVGIIAQSPGFPVLGFYPYTGSTLPPPASSFNFTDNAFYTTVRVLPFDNLVPQAFIDDWKAHKSPDAAWSFVYNKILYLYDMLFNVMLEHVNLGSRAAVEKNIGPIWSAISAPAAVESTYAMPITRDLSSGKRLTLQLWIYLVANHYNVPNFSVNSIPAGWTPPGRKH